VTRRSDEVNAEALDVVHGTIQPGDFDLAPVARPGIDFADVQRATQHLFHARFQLRAKGLDGASLGVGA
jgi:hypothetical protein